MDMQLTFQTKIMKLMEQKILKGVLAQDYIQTCLIFMIVYQTLLNVLHMGFSFSHLSGWLTM